MHVVRRFRYGIDGETEAVAGDSVCHIAPCQLRCDQSIPHQHIPRSMMPTGETGGAVSGSAKFWSEWQDLNLRPPRPEQQGLHDLSQMIRYFLNVRWFLFTFSRPKPLAKLWRSIEGITCRPKVIGMMMSIGLVKLPWCHSEILSRFPVWRAQLHQPRRRRLSE